MFLAMRYCQGRNAFEMQYPVSHVYWGSKRKDSRRNTLRGTGAAVKQALPLRCQPYAGRSDRRTPQSSFMHLPKCSSTLLAALTACNRQRPTPGIAGN